MSDEKQPEVNQEPVMKNLPPEEEQEQKAQGTVESVGSEVKDLKPGDRVLYGAFAGENIKTSESSKDVDYKLLLDEDVIAFIS